MDETLQVDSATNSRRCGSESNQTGRLGSGRGFARRRADYHDRRCSAPHDNVYVPAFAADFVVCVLRLVRTLPNPKNK